MKYKQELIANARTKQDKPISEEQIKQWFEKESQDEEDVSYFHFIKTIYKDKSFKNWEYFKHLGIWSTNKGIEKDGRVFRRFACYWFWAT